MIRALAKAGTPIKEIVRRTARSRRLVISCAAAAAGAMCSATGRTFSSRISLGSMPDGQQAAATAPSCGGSFGRQPAFEEVYASSPNRQRGADVPKAPGARDCGKPPPARMLSRMLLSERDQLTKGDAITVARIERGVPELVTARDLVERFHGMVRERDPTGLSTWITEAASCVLASFGKGIVTDRAAWPRR